MVCLFIVCLFLLQVLCHKTFFVALYSFKKKTSIEKSHQLKNKKGTQFFQAVLYSFSKSQVSETILLCRLQLCHKRAHLTRAYSITRTQLCELAQRLQPTGCKTHRDEISCVTHLGAPLLICNHVTASVSSDAPWGQLCVFFCLANPAVRCWEQALLSVLFVYLSPSYKKPGWQSVAGLNRYDSSATCSSREGYKCQISQI